MWIMLCWLIAILVVLSASFIFDRSLFGKRQVPTQGPNSLTHDAITTILSDMGHSGFDAVCYGFTLNWAAAVAEGNEGVFYKQLHLLRAHQSNLPTIVKQVEAKTRDNKLLTRNERVIKKIPVLLRKICMAQEPLDYKKQYGKLVWQSDIPSILRKITAKLSRVRRIFYKTHTFDSKTEANTYFNLLKNTGINGCTAVIISTDDHAMGFKLTGKLWRFMEINELFEQHIKKPYYEFTSEQLVNKLYELCISGTTQNRLTVNTDFIAKQSCDSLPKWLNNVYPIFPCKSKITYADKISFFSMAALQGDIEAVQKCLKSGWSIFFHDQLSDNSPLVTALTKGRRAVVQAMVSSPHYLINKKRKSDGFTLLHLACKYSGPEIVGDLLKIKGIRVDSQDRKGRTPLMIACKATIFTKEQRLFEQLCAHGASLTIKDAAGLTALDHAIQNNHQLAVKMIQNEMALRTRPASGSKKRSNNAAFFYKKAHKSISDDNTYLCLANNLA